MPATSDGQLSNDFARTDGWPFRPSILKESPIKMVQSQLPQDRHPNCAGFKFGKNNATNPPWNCSEPFELAGIPDSPIGLFRCISGVPNNDRPFDGFA